MRIGIDISQLAYPNAGVSNYLENLVRELIETNRNVEFVLFFSSLRGNFDSSPFTAHGSRVTIKKFKMPPTLLDLLWNKLHVLSIENLIGNVDYFITSDWTEPPAKRAKKATILYDLLVYKYPEEMHSKIVRVQKQKLKWVKRESSMVFCISKSTMKDAEEILGIDKNKLRVLYPGI